jgi:hypothetical protein
MGRLAGATVDHPIRSFLFWSLYLDSWDNLSGPCLDCGLDLAWTRLGYGLMGAFAFALTVGLGLHFHCHLLLLLLLRLYGIREYGLQNTAARRSRGLAWDPHGAGSTGSCGRKSTIQTPSEN